jgi:dienelactone hydrolase
VRRGVEIDELLGIPAEDRPGIDVPPVPESGGTRSIVHGSIAAVITGSFAAARVVEGAGSEIGIVRRDAVGRIAAGPREVVPFVLTIPKEGARTRLPIAIAHHGFNASRTTAFATAETAARAGVAVLAIDAFQHGDRAASTRDEVHNMRGDLPGPDGFAETSPADVSARVFGLLGAAPGLDLFPGYSLATFLQFAADVFSAARMIREGEVARVVSLSLGEEAVGFDAERIGFIGNSLGAVVGVSALVAEPTLRAAVQNVQPGSIVETLAESPEFRPLVETLFLPLLGVEGPFDEIERHLLFDPIVDLSRWVLEPIDPLALAPYLFRDPLRPGGAPEVLFQVAALDEVASPLATESMLAASAAPRATRYDPAAHGMLEVLLQSSRYEPPAVPPFRIRPAEIPVRNPLVMEHAEIEEFLTQALVAP